MSKDSGIVEGATSGNRTLDLRFTKALATAAVAESSPSVTPASGLVRSASSGVRFYHGGPPGLSVGDRILPPDTTGVESCKSFAAMAGLDARVIRTDRVYLTTNIAAARLFAALHPSGKGRVYEVLPDGPVEPDPDCDEPGLSWEAPSAEILSCIALSSSARRRILRQLEPAADGGRP